MGCLLPRHRQRREGVKAGEHADVNYAQTLEIEGIGCRYGVVGQNDKDEMSP